MRREGRKPKERGERRGKGGFIFYQST